MTTKEYYLGVIKEAEKTIAAANDAIQAIESAPENNVYATLKDAEHAIHGRFYSIAEQACEGSYCVGEPEYTQEFTVDGVRYLAKVEFEYNRHDKTYYYIESHSYSYAPI